MHEAKFKPGDVVLYRNGTVYELGIVKSVTTLSSELEGEVPYGYYVWYHTGDTAALTHESDLYRLNNSYAFTVLRRSVEHTVEQNPCIAMASVIMRVIDDVVRKNYGDENNLWLTEDEAEEQDDYPGMISGVRDEILEVITKVLKGEQV